MYYYPAGRDVETSFGLSINTDKNRTTNDSNPTAIVSFEQLRKLFCGMDVGWIPKATEAACLVGCNADGPAYQLQSRPVRL